LREAVAEAGIGMANLAKMAIDRLQSPAYQVTVGVCLTVILRIPEGLFKT
jgi:hypothetical protein